VSPSFCKRYATIGQSIQTALNEYARDVANDSFPGDQYAPYKMKDEQERAHFKEWAEQQVRQIKGEAAPDTAAVNTSKTGNAGTEQAAPLTEDETIKVY